MDENPEPSGEFNRVCGILRDKRELILKAWAARVRQKLPAAQEQTTPVLYDHIPQFIDRMADGLASTDSEGVRSSVEQVSVIHGESRAALPEYSIRQIILEYVVLRQSIFDVIESDGRLMARDVREAIMEGINEGIIGAAGEFTKSQDQLREQFIAILTHDLRNPLSAAKISMQLIPRSQGRVEKVETLASRAVASIKRVEVMIQDLLDTFQIRAGRPLPIVVRSDDFSKVAREAVDELSTVHGGRFVLNAPPSVPAQFCRDGITRSIENLSNNAVKYGDPHAPITVSVEERGRDTVEISVNNRGASLIAEEQAKLFLPFHRAPFARASGVKGWGLGLTLVQGVAKSHGGRVTVSSSQEDGTTFTMHLPRDAGRGRQVPAVSAQ